MTSAQRALREVTTRPDFDGQTAGLYRFFRFGYCVHEVNGDASPFYLAGLRSYLD